MPIRPSVKAIESNLLYIDEGGNLVLDTIGKLLGQIQSGVIPQFLVKGGPEPGGSLTLTDGTSTVASVEQITVSGATVGGTTPEATLSIGGTGAVTAVAGAATLNKQSGVVTSEALTSATNYTLTLTNSVILSTSAVLVTVTTSAGSNAVIGDLTPSGGSLNIFITMPSLTGRLKIRFAVFN